MSNLRVIKVTYSNNDVVITSMAAHLTDKEMLDYFSIGKWFNIGSASDNMQQVTNAKIIK